MTGPDLRFARRQEPTSEVVPASRAPASEAYASALGHAIAIEETLEAALPSASPADVYRIRLVQAVCSSLIGELMPLAQGGPKSSRASGQ
ncbi:MAG: hypothetical protein JNL38_08365 [Myxococcales bacterium]|jgi:hypothetical protein|nr:hypothetical protein [Myxococcales bacterium]